MLVYWVTPWSILKRFCGPFLLGLGKQLDMPTVTAK